LLEIADKIDKPVTEIKNIMDELIKHNLINLNSE
jgi:hypothetical protein